MCCKAAVSIFFSDGSIIGGIGLWGGGTGFIVYEYFGVGLLMKGRRGSRYLGGQLWCECVVVSCGGGG